MKFCMFNDDIQGTAGVALAGLFGTVTAQGQPLSEFVNQKIVVVGAVRKLSFHQVFFVSEVELNIYLEIDDFDGSLELQKALNCSIPSHGNLERWVVQWLKQAKNPQEE
ncbi:hypothetical protein L2E82_43189 [Cichorium intybus]|uniref:Uncharacterized protein n=1 Tax=Cichorium intybus TaxID=13427 RepID=A0ACB8ZNF4_CICIN|nr:hypothetical protein L2E82_43189 [Cichorium intybus]